MKFATVPPVNRGICGAGYRDNSGLVVRKRRNMNHLKNPYVMLVVGVIIGGTLLRNRVTTVPVVGPILAKIPAL